MGPTYRPSTRTWAVQAPTATKPGDSARANTDADADADADTAMADAPAIDAQKPSVSTSEARKRKRKEKETHVLYQSTFRKPTWSYLHLILVTPGTASKPASASAASAAASPDSRDMDALTVSTLVLQPLTTYLGITGAAVPMDILHTRGRSAYIRVPRQDARVLRAGLSGWVGSCDAGSVPGVQEGGRVNVAWRVVGEGGSLGLLRGTGEELFGEDAGAY